MKKNIRIFAILAITFLGGYLLSNWNSGDGGFFNSHSSIDNSETTSSEVEESTHNHSEYTCPMHPQIRQTIEGSCPICGMELVQANIGKSKKNLSENGLEISRIDRRYSGIETILVEPSLVEKKIETVGFLEIDESRLATISAYAKGRIESLTADFTGVSVNKGQILGVFYSPELFDAQVEYIESYKSRRTGRSQLQKELLKAAYSNLIELGMSKSQIAKLRSTQKAKARLEVLSPVSGTVISKKAFPGKYIKKGEVIFEIADLSTIWLMVDVFPEDAAFIKYGQKVSASVRSAPGKKFVGRVAFVDPIVNSTTRTVKVRVELKNSDYKLRPGDYAEAELALHIGIKGETYDPGLAGKWISPVHPQVVSDKEGICPISGSKLVPTKNLGYLDEKNFDSETIAIPRNAVLRIGNKSIVFVEDSKDFFTIRKIEVGPTIGDSIVVTGGLEEYESIATNGVFLLDSQMQLNGKTSLISIPNEVIGH